MGHGGAQEIGAKGFIDDEAVTLVLSRTLFCTQCAKLCPIAGLREGRAGNRTGSGQATKLRQVWSGPLGAPLRRGPR